MAQLRFVGGRKPVEHALALCGKGQVNTAAVCRKSYVHPAILDCFREGGLARWPTRARHHAGLSPEAAAGGLDSQATAVAYAVERSGRSAANS